MDNSIQEVSFRGKLTFQHYKDFQGLHSRNSMIYLFLYCVFLFIISAWAASSFDMELLPTYAGIGLIVGAVITMLHKLYLHFKTKSIYKSDKLIQKEYVYIINAHGISGESEIGNSTIQWSDVYKVKRNKKVHAIYIAKNKAMIIPADFVQSPDQLHLFERLLREHLSVKQYKLK